MGAGSVACFTYTGIVYNKVLKVRRWSVSTVTVGGGLFAAFDFRKSIYLALSQDSK